MLKGKHADPLFPNHHNCRSSEWPGNQSLWSVSENKCDFCLFAGGDEFLDWSPEHVLWRRLLFPDPSPDTARHLQWLTQGRQQTTKLLYIRQEEVMLLCWPDTVSWQPRRWLSPWPPPPVMPPTARLCTARLVSDIILTGLGTTHP